MRSCRLLHGRPRQPFEWNYFPILIGRILLSNSKKKSYLADPIYDNNVHELRAENDEENILPRSLLGRINNKTTGDNWTATVPFKSINDEGIH